MTLTVPAWHHRVTGLLDLLADTRHPFVLGVTRERGYASTLLYLDDPDLFFKPEITRALCDVDTPPYALLVYGTPVSFSHPLYGERPVNGLCVFAASIDDEDSVTALHRPGVGWTMFDADDTDQATRIRIRIWDLLLESALSPKECR